jgi:transposase
MEYGAIDLHTRRSQIRIVRDDGSIVRERKVDTTRDECDRVFGDRQPMRILIESSAESEWVAQSLEERGHEVIVADPNYLPMYGSRSRKIKTDRRDVAALAEACRTGIYRRAHRASAPARELRRTRRVRSHLVRVRSGAISLLRSLLRQEGVRLASGSAERVLDRFERVSLPAALTEAVQPLRALLTQLNTTLGAADAAVETPLGRVEGPAWQALASNHIVTPRWFRPLSSSSVSSFLRVISVASVDLRSPALRSSWHMNELTRGQH